MRVRASDVIAHLRGRAAFVAVLVLCAVPIAVHRATYAASGESDADAITRAAALRGVAVDPASVRVFAPAGSPLGYDEVLFLGSEGGAPTDVYYAAVRIAGDTVVDVDALTNVTRSPGAAERALVASREHAAFLSLVRGRVDAITVLALEGEPPADLAPLSRVQRAQHAITNVQETGRTRGFGRVRYALAAPTERGTLVARDGRFEVDLGGPRVVIDPAQEEPVEGASLVRPQAREVEQPAGITWLVDTVRGLSFVGPEPIAWLENRVFRVKDFVQRTKYDLLGGDDEGDATDELGVTGSGPTRRTEAELALGFPPAPLTPVVSDPSPGEGEWIVLTNDPFVGTYPNAPPAFAQSHMRVDPERPFARVYLVAWDPRQVQLRMVAGTREPEAASGATGEGIIPRDPELMPRVVAGFNGGFQSMHGEFGMMAEGTVYLPPKAYAATVGVYDDGQVAIGSWIGFPQGQRYTEEAAVAQIPAGMVEYRQNLTMVVEGDRYNPWERWYWGAAPTFATEQSRVDRSGLCTTREGFTIYFWGTSMGPEQLGEAMKRARCVRGMHLDMNNKHTAFEFYNVHRASEPFAPLGRALEASEFEADVIAIDGFRVRGRKAVTRMDPLAFPRYILRDQRDFFYLALRPTLPGPALPSGARFSTSGLPARAFPPAFARAEVGAGDQRVRVLRIDASRAVPGPVDERSRVHGRTKVAELVGASRTGTSGLYAETRGVGQRYGVGAVPPRGVLVVPGVPVDAMPGAHVAIGVDREGFLVYVERDEDDTRPFASVLEAIGVTAAVALPDEARLVVLDGDRRATAFGDDAPSGAGIPFLLREAPYSDVLFPEVVPQPYRVWNRIQDTRVRYFPEPGPRRFGRPAGT